MTQEDHDCAFAAGFDTARNKMNKHYGTKEQYERHRGESFAALTRRAGGDAIPAGMVQEGWRKNHAGVKNGSDCYRTIDGVRWFWEPTPPASLKGTGIRHRAAPEGNSFVHPDDIDKLDAHLNGATPKPPAGGDTGAVRLALSEAIGALQPFADADEGDVNDADHMAVWPTFKVGDLRRAVDAITVGRAALALPAPVVEGEAQKLRDALRDLEAACDDLAANRSRETYHNMIHCDRATPYLEALDEARRNARAALSEGRSHG